MKQIPGFFWVAIGIAIIVLAVGAADSMRARSTPIVAAEEAHAHP